MDSSSIKVSVVIPTYNRPDAALHCVRSVLSSDFSDALEIIIVDDCSKNCIVEDIVKRELPDEARVRVIRHEKNKNLAAARNTGGWNARGRYVFFIDDDNELRPDVMSKLVGVLDQGTYGVAAPLAVNILPSGEKTVWASSFAFNEWTSTPRNVDANADYTPEYEARMHGRVIDTWYSPNGYMMPRDLFEQLGGFYEWFGFYMEESDLCMRVRESGLKVCIVGDAVTWHRHYNDVGDMVMRRFAANTSSKAFRLSRNRLHFAWRHYLFPKVLSILFVFAPLVTLRYMAMAIFRGWPKIGFAFVWGYCVGFVQVLCLMAAQVVLWPFGMIGKLFFKDEKVGLSH